MQFQTAAIHGGIYGDPTTGAVATPIVQSSTFAQTALGQPTAQWEYSRSGNPTRAAIETLIAELENGVRGFAFASGMAAITAVLHLFKPPCRIALSQNVYGGTYRVLANVFAAFGITPLLLDTSDLAAFEAGLTADVAAVLIETPANPLLTVTDIAAVADIARRKHLPLIVDNTFMTPYLQRPLELGADIVLHSATKYLGGHSDLIAGLVVVKDEATAERLGYIQNATGGILQPFDAFLLVRSVKTLPVRMDAHAAGAEELAAWLRKHPAVETVYVPDNAIQRKQAKNAGGMISFTLQKNIDIKRFFASLRLIALAESLGGVESLVCHPASMTHASMPAEVRERVGITDALIRFSVGIEHPADLIADLSRAFEEARM